MGSWNITIQGDGAHHNKNYPNDTDKMVDRFVDELIAAGHDIKSATITYGGRQIFNLGAKKADHFEKGYTGENNHQEWLESIRSKKTFLE